VKAIYIFNSGTTMSPTCA